MKHYENRFHMTPEQSLFLAKKKWDENVYCGMRMENRNITFPQTKTILQGVNVPSVQLDDIQAVLNMRDAWRFLLSSIGEPLTFEYWSGASCAPGLWAFPARTICRLFLWRRRSERSLGQSWPQMPPPQKRPWSPLPGAHGGNSSGTATSAPA